MQLDENLLPALPIFINDDAGASFTECAILAALTAVVCKLLLLALHERL